jgi:2-polyprenyl-3-methyl-5-hydroxy-6-metoxy-1,4-benzoquinol methylase
VSERRQSSKNTGPLASQPSNDPSSFDPALYDNISPGYYDEVYRRGRGVQWFWHDERFKQVLQNLPPRVARILDVGCGPGTFLGQFHGRYQRAVGIDIATQQIAYAQQRYEGTGAEFRVGDLRDQTMADQGFDAIVSIEVIEHLPANDVQHFLRLIYGALQPGGMAVLTTPNYRSTWPLVEWLVSVIGPVDYRRQHLTHFHPAMLRRELEQAGFIVERVSTFFVISPFLAAASGMLARRVARFEEAILPRWGSEIVARARRPETEFRRPRDSE